MLRALIKFGNYCSNALCCSGSQPAYNFAIDLLDLPHKVLTHWQKKERECDGGDDRRADGEQHLHRVEEEEHDQEGDRGAEGQAHGLDGVEGLNPAR